MKKAELSISVVVMAVVAILILVVLAFIVLRQTGNFNQGISACNGRCVTSSSECTSNEAPQALSCKTLYGSDGSICCLAVGK